MPSDLNPSFKQDQQYSPGTEEAGLKAYWTNWNWDMKSDQIIENKTVKKEFRYSIYPSYIELINSVPCSVSWWLSSDLIYALCSSLLDICLRYKTSTIVSNNLNSYPAHHFIPISWISVVLKTRSIVHSTKSQPLRQVSIPPFAPPPQSRVHHLATLLQNKTRRVQYQDSVHGHGAGDAQTISGTVGTTVTYYPLFLYDIWTNVKMSSVTEFCKSPFREKYLLKFWQLYHNGSESGLSLSRSDIPMKWAPDSWCLTLDSARVELNDGSGAGTWLGRDLGVWLSIGQESRHLG